MNSKPVIFRDLSYSEHQMFNLFTIPTTYQTLWSPRKRGSAPQCLVHKHCTTVFPVTLVLTGNLQHRLPYFLTLVYLAQVWEHFVVCHFIRRIFSSHRAVLDSKGRAAHWSSITVGALQRIFCRTGRWGVIKIFLNGRLPLLNRSFKRESGERAKRAQVQVSRVTFPERFCRNLLKLWCGALIYTSLMGVNEHSFGAGMKLKWCFLDWTVQSYFWTLA